MSPIINSKQFRIISLDFRNVSSDLLNANNETEAERALKKFLQYIENEPIINDFVQKNNLIKYDIKKIYSEQEGYSSKYDIPVEDSKEIAFIYQLLKHVVENNISYTSLAFGYGGSKKFSVMIQEFNRQVVRLLISQITRYLEKLGVEMGLNDKHNGINFNLGSNSQLNISQNGDVNATQNNVSNNELLTIVQDLIKELNQNPLQQTDLQEDVIDDLTDIEEATRNSEQPRRSLIRRTVEKLTTVNDLTEQGTTLSVNILRGIELLGNVAF